MKGLLYLLVIVLISFPFSTYGILDLSCLVTDCGNGVLCTREACDDHNNNNGDGCHSDCNIEVGWICSGEPSVCVERCGDGAIVGSEICDDGNIFSGDGCSSDCRTIENPFTCPNPGTSCIPICGDGLIRGNENCDDNNTINNDGCSSICQPEIGYGCSGEPSSCSLGCGDGTLGGNEVCDDNNNNNNDGCSSFCSLENGYLCNTTISPSFCFTICGDGIKAGIEECDDGNLNPDDGCSMECLTEVGFLCINTINSSLCTGICGDGLIIGNETCDDNNTQDEDGCSSLCLIESGYSCSLSSSSFSECFAVCGDGNTVGNGCDDGNNADQDGCNAQCQIEVGFECTSQPSVCRTMCGDGMVAGSETCDDGNQISGDGCSSLCERENSNGLDLTLILELTIPLVLCAFCCCFGMIIILIFYIKLRKKRNSSQSFLMELNTDIPILQDVVFGQVIGSGNFGTVYKGKWQGIDIALKSLKRAQIQEFESELNLLVNLRHPNTITFYGLCLHDDEQFMATEFMNKGDLLHFLQLTGEVTHSSLISFAQQCAIAMEFLHSQKIIHRDLAARNLLISTEDDEKFNLKVTDFGLSRQVEEYYTVTSNEIPVRWTAPEVFQFGKATAKSDVWSFGIVLWEIFSRGGIPYSGLTNRMVLEEVPKGLRCNIPFETPSTIAEAMQNCWQKEPEDRPLFSQLVQDFSSASANFQITGQSPQSETKYQKLEKENIRLKQKIRELEQKLLEQRKTGKRPPLNHANSLQSSEYIVEPQIDESSLRNGVTIYHTAENGSVYGH